MRVEIASYPPSQLAAPTSSYDVADTLAKACGDEATIRVRCTRLDERVGPALEDEHPGVDGGTRSEQASR